MHAILQAGGDGETIRIVSRIELTAFLSDKGGGVPLAWRSGLNRRKVMSATNKPATMKGPAIFLAQFVGDAPPFNSFDAICGWAAGSVTRAFRSRPPIRA